jgi:lipopolysaccharide transport system permease protein
VIAMPASRGTFLRRREVVFELAKRELRDRHVGQILGVIWAYGHPLLLMLIYSFLFAYVFPTRYAGHADEHPDFAVSVLSGALSWLAFQEVLARSTMILPSHASLVKQIVFPVEVLPIKTAIVSALVYSVALAFTIVYAGFSGTLTGMALTVPLLVATQLIAMVGVAFLLSALGIFFRDLRDIVTVFCCINLFAQPILYNPYALPDVMRWVFMANPFSYQVWCWQDALFHGRFEHPIAWIVFPLCAASSLALGFAVFSQLKHSFGEVL